MPIGTRYFFVVSMDVPAAKEDLFNQVYETEHVPYLTAVPVSWRQRIRSGNPCG